MSCCCGVSWLLLILFVGFGFIVVISWKLVGYVVFFEVWDKCMLLVLSGLCNIFSVFCLNLGSLFRNKILLWVSDILFGIGFELLLVSVIVELVWWGEWRWWVRKCFVCSFLFFIEWMVVIFNVFFLFILGNSDSIWLVSRFLFVLGGFIISKLCVLFVVIISVCLVCFWLIMLFYFERGLLSVCEVNGWFLVSFLLLVRCL